MAAATPKEKFEAAVNVIHSLPKNGSFQPSYAMMLTFYGLYKQATLGTCNIGKPGFWDVIGKAKWDAWKRLGSMAKEVAMTQYVDELKKIIETMPHTENVQEFVERLGDFYEVVDDDTPLAQMVRNASPKHKNTTSHASPTSPELTDMEGLISKPNALGQDSGRDESSFSSSDSARSSPQRVSPTASLDAPHSFHSTSAGGQRVNGPGEPTSDSGSDADEFCDTSDINLQDNAVIRKSSPALSSDPEGRLSNLDSASSNIPVAGKPHSNSRTAVNHLRPVDLVPGGKDGYQPTTDVTNGTADHLVLALGRLQQDMNSALVRLQAMETLFMAQKEALEKTRLSQRRPNKWKLFAGVNYPTIAFLIAWPFVIHVVMRYMTRKRH